MGYRGSLLPTPWSYYIDLIYASVDIYFHVTRIIGDDTHDYKIYVVGILVFCEKMGWHNKQDSGDIAYE